MSDLRHEAIMALRECRDICRETFVLHCTKAGGKHMAREHMRRMVSCMELCSLTADFILCRFPLVQELCSLCVEVCKQCIASCSAMRDRYMNDCVRACEKAVRACLEENYHLKHVSA